MGHAQPARSGFEGVVDRMKTGFLETALTDDWERLSPAVRALHQFNGSAEFAGHAQVERGGSCAARLLAEIFRFPPAAARVAVSVRKTRHGTRETWERSFGDRVFRSSFAPSRIPGRYLERFGPFSFELDLPVDDGSLRLTVVRGWCLGIPLPRGLLPVSDSREYEEDGRFHFDVAIHAPLGQGLVVRYRGTLAPASD